MDASPAVPPAPAPAPAKSWVRHPLGLGLWLAGLVSLAAIVWGLDGLRERWRWQRLPSVPCVFMIAEVVPAGGERYTIRVLYRYTVDGVEHLGSRYRSTGSGDYGKSGFSAADRTVRRLTDGMAGTCRYEPEDAQRSSLVAGGEWVGLVLAPLAPFLYVLIRLAAFQLWWRDRQERRALAAGRVWSATRPPALRGQAALAALMLLMGGGALTGTTGWPLWRLWQGRERVAVPCTIVHSGVETIHSHNGPRHELRLDYAYIWDGRERHGQDLDYTVLSFRPPDEDRRLAEAHPPDSTASAWILPADPDDAVLERTARWDPLTCGMGVGLLGLGVYLWWMRRERLRRDRGPWTRSAAGTRRGATADPPTVLAGPPAARMAVLTAGLAVVLGASFAWYLPGTVRALRAGGFDIIMVFVLLAGAFAVYMGFLTWRWLRWLVGGRPWLALAGPPPRPGAVVALAWRLDARAARRVWTLLLVQEERGPVTKVMVSQHGSSLDEEQKARIVREQFIGLLPAGGRDGALALAIPHDASPSFDLGGFAVAWSLVAVDDRGRVFRHPLVIGAIGVDAVEGA